MVHEDDDGPETLLLQLAGNDAERERLRGVIEAKMAAMQGNGTSLGPKRSISVC